MSSESSNVKDRISIGRIPLKQVRVSRNEAEKGPPPNPMNNLVPYLDLFCRLGDAELARLGGVDLDVCVSLRAQVDTIGNGLAAYSDLLPRLSDSELVRLTGTSDRTIRFWRLCQPRHAVAAAPPVATSAAATKPRTATPGVPDERERSPTAPHSVAAESPRDNTGRLPTVAAMDVVGDGDDDGAGYVTLSGAPFPGFDEEAGAGADGLEGVSLDGDPDPLGLGDP